MVQNACLARDLQPASLMLLADFPIVSCIRGGERGSLSVKFTRARSTYYYFVFTEFHEAVDESIKKFELCGPGLEIAGSTVLANHPSQLDTLALDSN